MVAERGHKAAVQGGKLLHFSVSQIKDFQRCQRLWAASKIFDIRALRTKAQARGTSNHKGPEAWYKAGIEPTNEAFLAARPGLPERHVDLLVEHHLIDPTLFVDDVLFEGHSDLIVPPHLNRGVPRVIDWKFGGGFNYMQDPANDLQCLVYGYWVSRCWPAVKEIALELWYFRAEGSPDFRPQRAVVPVERCEAEWHDIVVPTVRRMRDLVATAPADFVAVAPNFADNYAACRKYGGCYHASRCGVALHNKTAKLSFSEAALLAAFDSGA